MDENRLVEILKEIQYFTDRLEQLNTNDYAIFYHYLVKSEIHLNRAIRELIKIKRSKSE